MTSTTRWFVLVFGLLLGTIFSQGVKASAGETTGENSTLEVQAASQPVTVANLTAVSKDTDLPDDPGAGVQQKAQQQQVQVASGAPAPQGARHNPWTRWPRGDKPNAFFLSYPIFAR